jgi:hypothetical protein
MLSNPTIHWTLLHPVDVDLGDCSEAELAIEAITLPRGDQDSNTIAQISPSSQRSQRHGRAEPLPSCCRHGGDVVDADHASSIEETGGSYRFAFLQADKELPGDSRAGGPFQTEALARKHLEVGRDDGSLEVETHVDRMEPLPQRLEVADALDGKSSRGGAGFH